MINIIKILSTFGNFKMHFMKIHLSFIILRKISENSVHFSQFKDTFTLKILNVVKFYITFLTYNFL